MFRMIILHRRVRHLVIWGSLVRDTLVLRFILIRTTILPILLCLPIYFDTLICGFYRQHEYITHLFMRLLIRLMIQFVLLWLWKVSLLVQNSVGIDEVLSVSTISILPRRNMCFMYLLVRFHLSSVICYAFIRIRMIRLFTICVPLRAWGYPCCQDRVMRKFSVCEDSVGRTSPSVRLFVVILLWFAASLSNFCDFNFCGKKFSF